MKLTREDVLKLARLSRLKLSEEEIESYRKELAAILEYVRQLEDVAVEGLKPTYQVTGLTSQDANATRDDKPGEQVPQAELLKNVPRTQDGHIQVKRMIG